MEKETILLSERKKKANVQFRLHLVLGIRPRLPWILLSVTISINNRDEILWSYERIYVT